MRRSALPPLRLEQVSQYFDKLEVLRDLHFTAAPGEFIVLVGPSGCGKTTLLNLCSGWLAPSRGRVERPAQVRTVFQHDGLFPWLTVIENMHLGLRHLYSEAERQQRGQALLELSGLVKFSHHYPHQLSGGMRQRVELARALGGETDLLLMDEPFSSLDYLTRHKLYNELVRLLCEEPRTVVLVTHDIDEAVQLADRVLVLSERPGCICDEVTLSSPRPRDSAQPDVVVARQRILTKLGLQTEVNPIKEALCGGAIGR